MLLLRSPFWCNEATSGSILKFGSGKPSCRSLSSDRFIKRGLLMAKPLFGNFLTDANEYRQAEDFWENLWRKQVDPHALHTDWKVWINTQFADGTAFMDGNPIFSRVSVVDGRAVRV